MKLGLKLIGIVALVGYAAIAVSLAVRRWVCSVPWTSECLSALGSRFESFVLFLWVKDPETIISALIAVAAAAATVIYLKRQIDQADRHERKRWARRFRAARAVFPLNLSAVCDYASSLGAEWRRLRNEVTLAENSAEGLNPHAFPRNANFPVLAPELVQQLALLVETTNKSNGKPIIELLGRIQVAMSRSRDFAAKLSGPDAIGNQVGYANGQIVEAVEIYARASMLFDFARGEGPAPSAGDPPRSEMSTALLSMGFYGNEGEITLMVNRGYAD